MIAKRKDLKLHMGQENNQPFPTTNLMVPRLLYGASRAQSHRRWKSVARKAAKTGAWEAALSGIEFMPLDQVQGDFSVDKAFPRLFTGENLWVDETYSILLDVTADHLNSTQGLEDPVDPNDWAKLLERLTVSGLDHFWFALCLCVTDREIIMWRDLGERQRVARLYISKLLHWWPQLCVYDQRFSAGQKFGLRGWNIWARGLNTLCRQFGVPWSDIQGRVAMGPQALADAAAEWLQRL
jgi:hypothetical protein